MIVFIYKWLKKAVFCRKPRRYSERWHGLVRRRLFCAPFYTSNRIFYQDRLGTNTGKVEKREADLFCCRDRTLIAPTVAGNLTGVEATVGTVRGDIKVEWSSSDTACGFGKVTVYLVDRSKHSTAAETAALFFSLVFKIFFCLSRACLGKW